MQYESLINGLFDGCVHFLLWLGALLGMSYKAINVWIFCLLWPAFTMALIVVILYQWSKLRRLTKLSSKPSRP